jgi:ankyrin repeat protein
MLVFQLQELFGGGTCSLSNFKMVEINQSIDYEEDIDLHKACRFGNIDLIKQAIHTAPDKINDRDESLGWTPLYRTVICGHVKASRYLLKKGANPNTENNLGETPLH